MTTPDPKPGLYAILDDTGTLQPLCTLDADEYAGLPDCEHCGGTGKDAAAVEAWMNSDQP